MNIETLATRFTISLCLVVGAIDYAQASIDPLNKSIECLAVNSYHEARGEGVFGALLVADVVLNRVDSKKYPNNICDVVKQKYQFSWFNGKSHITSPDNLIYNEIKELCKNMILKLNHRGLSQGSLYYHRVDINPKWARDMDIKLTIDNHVFY